MAPPLIFIVDDDPVFAKTLDKILENAGFDNNVHFSDGMDCIDNISKIPKFVFLDFALESLNGLDVLIRIKKYNKRIKVFVVTNIDNQELSQKCLDNGASLYVNKNEIVTKMPDRLLRVISKRRLFNF